MPTRFFDRIISFLNNPEYEPMRPQRLARALGIASAEQGDFHDAVDALRRLGRVVLGSNNAVMLPQPRGEVSGTFRGNPRGFGFVVPDEPTVHGDLFIPPGSTLDAVTGDLVLCRVVRRGRRAGKPSFGGQIVKILRRGQSRFVGRLCEEGGIWFVQPDGHVLHAPIFVADATAKAARAGDQVVVEIFRYPSEGKPAQGAIVERLGASSDAGIDLLSIIRQYELPTEWPEQALAEARTAVARFNATATWPHREDLTNLTIITIDPDDARDHDDAISLRRLDGPEPGAIVGKGGRTRPITGEPRWELGVHIADVSAFVPAGGALDRAAAERCTSVYFPNHVIPMLPEVLSNGVCSLQENEPRLCKTAFIRYDAAGRVLGTRIANTIIRSTKHLTYRQASAILEGKRGGVSADVVTLLREMEKLARVIQQRRLAEGMVVLDLPELEVRVDAEGRTISAGRAESSFSHTIIEMFMIEANEAVARHLRGLGVPFIRRIHPEPDEESLESLARLLRASGVPVPRTLAPADLRGLLENVRNRPESYALNLAVLKSMQLAEYSTEDVGHFALASDCYAHFTSPIRRYADLTIHRLLERTMGLPSPTGKARRRRAASAGDTEKALRDLSRRLSYVSRRAESAEQEYKTLKVLQLMNNQVGESFRGVITGVTNFGLFVQHPTYLLDGLLRVENLGDDWWEVDTKSGCVIGERSRRMFRMGQLLEVQIAQVDLAARQLMLVPVDRSTKPVRQTKRQQRAGRVRPTARVRGRPEGSRKINTRKK